MASLKILIVPSVLFFSILFSIFWVKPLYEETQLQRLKLSERNGVLEKAKTLQSNSQSLLRSLRENMSGVELLSEVFPREDDVEYVAWTLSRAAQISGVTLENISIEGSQENVASEAQSIQAVPQDEGSEILNGAENAGVSSTSTPEIVIGKDALSIRNVSGSFSVSGSYESIKKYLETMQSMPRKYVIRDSSLGKDFQSSESEGSSLERRDDRALSIKISMDFPYASLRKVQQGVISPAFEKSALDFDSLEAMQLVRSQYNWGEDISAGRSNPFFP